MSWRLVFTKQAQKDAKKIAQSGLKPQANRLLDLLREDPYRNPPPYEKLVGDLSGAYSRRINIQHRLIYQILKDIHTVKVIRMWNDYPVIPDMIRPLWKRGGQDRSDFSTTICLFLLINSSPDRAAKEALNKISAGDMYPGDYRWYFILYKKGYER